METKEPNVVAPTDDNTPVTEQVCELKRKDVSGLAAVITEFRKDFREFKDNEFRSLVTSITDANKQISDVCNDVNLQGAWQEGHEKSHSRSAKLLALFLQGGSWLVALISLILLFLSQTGILGKKP